MGCPRRLNPVLAIGLLVLTPGARGEGGDPTLVIDLTGPGRLQAWLNLPGPVPPNLSHGAITLLLHWTIPALASGTGWSYGRVMLRPMAVTWALVIFAAYPAIPRGTQPANPRANTGRVNAPV